MEKINALSKSKFYWEHIFWLGFDSEKRQGQCYECCATMMGKKEVATQIKNDIQPLAFCIHYHARGYMIRKAAVISKSLDTSYEITKLVKFSPKRDSHLRKIHEEKCYANEENLQHYDCSVGLGGCRSSNNSKAYCC